MKLNIDFKEIITKYILINKLFTTTVKSKYTLDEIINVIEYLLKTGSSWRSLSLSVFKDNYKWQSIYYHFNKIYKQILAKYFKNNVSGKLKYLSVDSSFIKNECAPNSEVGFNGHYKKKRLSKLSLIDDINGIT